LLLNLQDDNGGNESDTETGNETTSNHDIETRRGSLENAANDEDEASKNDSHAATDEVGKITSDDSSEEGTGGKNGSGQGLMRLGNNEGGLAVGLDLSAVFRHAGEFDLGVLLSGILLDEVVHSKDTSHPTSVIPEEDTTKGGKGDNQVGPDGDGRLNARDIVRARNGDDSSTWHDCGCSAA
jgi:hypothetical protein